MLTSRMIRWLMNWKGCGWKWSWIIWGTTSDCAWMNWRKPRGFAVRSADLLSDIWTLDRLITKLFATNSAAIFVGTVIALRFGLGKVLSSNPSRILLMRVFLWRSPYSPSRMSGSRQPCTTLNRFLRRCISSFLNFPSLEGKLTLLNFRRWKSVSRNLVENNVWSARCCWRKRLSNFITVH